MIGWDFEVDAYSRFWRWHLIKICVWTCDMNSTLRSVVPLAMFLIKKPNLLNRCHTRFLPGCYMNFLRHLFLPWSVFARFLFPRSVRSEFVRVVVGLVNWRVLGSKRHKKQSKKNKTRTVIVRDFELNLLGGTLNTRGDPEIWRREKQRMEGETQVLLTNGDQIAIRWTRQSWPRGGWYSL